MKYRALVDICGFAGKCINAGDVFEVIRVESMMSNHVNRTMIVIEHDSMNYLTIEALTEFCKRV